MRSETIKNKIFAILLIAAGAISVIPEHDITLFVVTLVLGVALFFSKENHIT